MQTLTSSEKRPSEGFHGFCLLLSSSSREYELITEGHAKLSVVGNCSKSSLRVCLGEGKQLAGGG
jgi:hypothetical protein